MKSIGIIGGGFSGTMTAIQLIQKSSETLSINIIDNRENPNRGIAYSTYSDLHLLNVVAAKMSAFPDQPDHFVNWVVKQKEYVNLNRELLSISFLSRSLFGKYMDACWKEALALAEKKEIPVTYLINTVNDLSFVEDQVLLLLANGSTLLVDRCVIATGNHLPANPSIKNIEFYDSNLYHRNPWLEKAVLDTDSALPVLIIGNGLTMVDTVMSLLDHKFHGPIISLSPNGFNILPHRHGGVKYTALIEELSDSLSLKELIELVNKHVKAIRNFGISAEPVIDSLRPHTQRIWQNLTPVEKRIFHSRLRHLWGVARHRIPTHVHDKLQQLRIDGKLKVIAARLMDIYEDGNAAEVVYKEKGALKEQKIRVGRVINCTGPESNYSRLESHFLRSCLAKGIITQDDLKLGINTDVNSFRVKNNSGGLHENLYTLGSNLRGELWESTAVNELRNQASQLAEVLQRNS